MDDLSSGKRTQPAGRREVLPRRHPHPRGARDHPERAAAGALASRGADGRAEVGRRSGVRRRRERARHDQHARGRARGRHPEGAVRLVGRRDLRRAGRVPGAGDATRTTRSRPTASPRRRASTTCISTTPCTACRTWRCATPTSTARVRIRTARPASSRSSPSACSRTSRPRSTATASRRATTSSSATSCAPTWRALERPFVGSVNIGTGVETDVSDPVRAPARADRQPAPGDARSRQGGRAAPAA